MIFSDLTEEYFGWMCKLISNNRYSWASYRRLLDYLHHVEFVYSIEMDGNRAEDGIDLRYRFGREKGYSDPMIAVKLDNCPCSILEMMVALAIRCEEHIMEDSDIGDRTGQWFWSMIESLGLESMTNVNFNRQYVEEVIRSFLDRDYKRNGDGGLFTVEHCNKDMRSVEIWYQMCMYLDSIL